ncbi:hypothetical protein DL763_005033 [Monosporascus cannonballus]|nr:hypothetical protein DL763_005033 [Monosporascus cannonballus]
MALFFSAATLAGAFGGILARGIAEMHGVGGLSAWSWIFILEGPLSILISCTAYWAIYDYPATASFLTSKEPVEVEGRLDEDHGHLSNDFDFKYVWQAIKDWKIYIHMMICNAGFCPIYSFALFSPTITRNIGYAANEAQLMSVPPYVFACFFTITGSWFADRYRRREVFLLGFQLLAIVGFALLASTSNQTIQYTDLVLAACGIYPQIPLGLAWNGSNIGGSLTRGTGIAMQVMGGNCGGIIASCTKPTIVIAHGDWHVPASYKRLATALESAGYEVHVLRLPSVNQARPPNADLSTDTEFMRSYVESLARAGHTVVALLHS